MRILTLHQLIENCQFLNLLPDALPVNQGASVFRRRTNMCMPMVNSCSISPRSHQFHVFFQQKHTHIYIYINIYIYILSLWIQPRWECNWDMTNRGAIGLGFSSPFQTWNSRNRGLGLWADLATPKSISPLANHYVPPFDGKQKHTTWGSIPLSDTHSVAEGFIGWKLGSGSAAVGLRLFVLSSKQTEDV